MKFRLVTYWAGAHYERWAKGLELSARGVGVPITVYHAEDAGDWQKNTLLKPDHIFKAMLDYPGENIVWVDADCSVLGYPELFEGLDGFNFAIFAEADATNGSVAFFRNNDVVRRVLKLWKIRNLECPGQADDENLWQVLKRHSLARVHFLEPAYCWNERLMRHRFPTAQPKIEMHLTHMLAGK